MEVCHVRRMEGKTDGLGLSEGNRTFLWYRQAHLTLLHLADSVFFFFNRLKVFFFFFFTDWRFGQHCLKQIYQYYFSTSICLFISLCHILAILIKYLTFPLLHLLWACVITILGHHESCTCKTAISLMFILTALLPGDFHHSPPQASPFPEIQWYWN